ncbi:hypothetical protein, partial [Aeromonas rivipollensis]|uniref:hypothetical protein n=1 Tax=Aeromonas rivipollensis TaxID=948519 RepID=UPI003D012599
MPDMTRGCLFYTSYAADEKRGVEFGGWLFLNKKKSKKIHASIAMSDAIYVCPERSSSTQLKR